MAMTSVGAADAGHAVLLAANDPVLGPLIGATSIEDRRSALETVLIGHARPIVMQVLARQRGSDVLMGLSECEDIASTVMLRLVRKLQLVPFDESEAVLRLGDFAATLTYNAIYDFMRRRFPEWTRLKNRVRYVLMRDRRFVTWDLPGGRVCALEGQAVPDRTPLAPPDGFTQHLDRHRPADAVATVLKTVAGPLLVDDVVRVLARAWNVADAAVDVDTDHLGKESMLTTEVEGRSELDAIWREIRALPVPQRAALLLNLRDADGGNAIALFAMIGTATLEEIARVIELPLPQIAAMWDRLPIDDLEIASILGLKRQQVINLRRSARERLTRRMKKR